MTTEPQADIVERLTAMYSHRGDGLPTQYVNPDGLEAATEITRLRAQLAEAELRGVKAGLEAVAVAVAQSTPQPGAVVNQCLAELGDAEPLVVSKEDDGWAVRTLSAWRLLHPAADDALREENARLREVLENAGDAIDEMFRYFDGGETRGSYDGKPERAQLRKAGYAVRAALTGRQGCHPRHRPRHADEGRR